MIEIIHPIINTPMPDQFWSDLYFIWKLSSIIDGAPDPDGGFAPVGTQGLWWLIEVTGL